MFYDVSFLFDFFEVIVQFLNGLKRCNVDGFYAIIIGIYNANHHSSIPIPLFRLTMLYRPSSSLLWIGLKGGGEHGCI